MTEQKQPWHQDQRLMVTLIIAFIGQLGTTVWWASGQDQRVGRLEAQTVTIVAEATAREARIRALELGAGRTEEKLIGIQSSLGRIENLLEDLRP